ncbi:MAG: aminopeptidase [Anaerolineales bacterium]|nr:aminopeptidase [Anaerolineales bacterium]
MLASEFSENLKKYADLIIHVGLNLGKGQRLAIINLSTAGVQLHAAPLVREITCSAFQAGAEDVEVFWGDEAINLLRYENASEKVIARYPSWQVKGIMDIIESGGAVLTIRSNNPDLLGNIDPDLLSKAQAAYWEAVNPILEKTGSNTVNWCVTSASSPDWAPRVFPLASPEEAYENLWQAIFQITRVDQPDPGAAWEAHIKELESRSQYLEAKQYAKFHYQAPGTDLTVGLPKGHLWGSARDLAKNGIDFVANLPTEEIFTLPHREQAEGIVRATLPLPYGGITIEDFSLTFENGRVVKVNAKKGEKVLQNLIDTDEGAARLGEAALVPHNSPIAQRGHLFYNPLIDENAACHLAIGKAYPFTLKGGDSLSKEEFAEHGGNNSLIHIDFMIGSNEMDIDGITEDGTVEPVMRDGLWAFDVY